MIFLLKIDGCRSRRWCLRCAGTLVLFFLALKSEASSLIVEFYSEFDSPVPFKEIRCQEMSCVDNGLLPLEKISIPLEFKVHADTDGKVFIDDLRRSESIHYGVRPLLSDTFVIDSLRQPGKLYRNRNQDGQNGVINDLVLRGTYDIEEVWISASMVP